MEELQGTAAQEMNAAQTAGAAAQTAGVQTADPIASTGTFTEEEKSQIREYADTINIRDTKTIIEYGSGVQKQMADFSETIYGMQLLSLIRMYSYTRYIP